MNEALPETGIDQNLSFPIQEQALPLLEKSKTGAAVNLCIALLTWLAIPSPDLIWLWFIVGASLLRLTPYFWYKTNKTPPHNFSSLYWLTLIAVTLQGAAWGYASVSLFASATEIHRFYLMVIVCGMSGGAILSLTPSFFGFLCFTIPSTVPIVVAFFMASQEPFQAAGLMGVVFILAVIFLAKRICLSHRDLINSHINLERLSRELAQHKEHLETLVQERTKELEDSREKYRLLTEEINDAIYELDHKGIIQYVSPAVTSILGIAPEALKGIHYTKIIYPEDLAPVLKKFSEVMSGDLGPAEYRMIDSRGNPHWVRTSSRPIQGVDSPAGLRGVLTDIENEKRSEFQKEALLKRINENQKLEAIGTLAAGIAHDFNNLLMGIQGHSSLLALKLDSSNCENEHLHTIEDLVQSATKLTAQLLGAARGGKYNPKPTDLNELVKNSSAMFSQTRKEIELKVQTVATPLVAEVDKVQIEQVLLNMYVNAWQAMLDGGQLELETSATILDDAYCEPFQAKGGCYAKISVTDTGTGMDEYTRARVFDPFFTTKEKERGTGLGLASAYGIIKNHGGFITVASEIAQGTTFNIYLPLSDRMPVQEIPAENKIIEGSETILLIDDEEMILKVGQAILKKLGYRAITALGGKEALKHLEDNGETVNLVILDMVMPGMDGSETFDHIRKLFPSMPIILSSGYAIDGKAAEIMRRGCNSFIQKPFNVADLSQKIRNVIGEKEIG
ncbi:MAG: response regulator [Deltaproteobacteria bacterium]|nr:response regulator [Deltaproteobacteria bacterium]